MTRDHDDTTSPSPSPSRPPPPVAARKLDQYRLSDEARPITGSFTGGGGKLVVERSSFAVDAAAAASCAAPGALQNMNTVADFKAMDKNAFMAAMAETLWADIKSGAAVADPTLLLKFGVISFADLKRHHFVYWFAFPALVSPSPFRLARPAELLRSFLSPGRYASLQAGMQQLRRAAAPAGCPPFFLAVGGAEGGEALRVLPLSEWDALAEDERERAMLGFADPCTLPDHPGWPLRNLLVLAAARWKLRNATIICYRRALRPLDAGDAPSGGGGDEADRSIALEVLLDDALGLAAADDTAGVPAAVGWETNARGKNGPRQMDLSAVMDPRRLAESSVDLNLKLMRWRLLPDLDTDLIFSTRCLLLGAGTLGCNVARCLLGWGVRNITFVDNGRVSYSNPVRQSLFEFADCADGGKPKAEAAAAALRRIFPGVNAAAHELTIPMPGHALTVQAEIEQARLHTEQLEALIEAHDVVFLLTDTRESRWLPTMLSTLHDRMLLNVALGLDTYLILRHGAAPKGGGGGGGGGEGGASGGSGGGGASEGVAGTDAPPLPPPAQASPQLGCYFCNDVVAPDNSTRDRTLDQQCTVTRPGLAPIASALAVELMVALLHHPDRHHAPADAPAEPMAAVRSSERPLGLLPHTLRYDQRHITVAPLPPCSPNFHALPLPRPPSASSSASSSVAASAASSASPPPSAQRLPPDVWGRAGEEATRCGLATPRTPLPVHQLPSADALPFLVFLTLPREPPPCPTCPAYRRGVQLLYGLLGRRGARVPEGRLQFRPACLWERRGARGRVGPCRISESRRRLRSRHGRVGRRGRRRGRG